MSIFEVAVRIGFWALVGVAVMEVFGPLSLAGVAIYAVAEFMLQREKGFREGVNSREGGD